MPRATLPAPVLPAVAIAAAWWLFTDLAAVWGPSLITIFGQAADTPAELMGVFALGCVLAAYVVETVGTQEYSFTPTEFLGRLEESYGSAAADEVAPHLKRLS